MQVAHVPVVDQRTQLDLDGNDAVVGPLDDEVDRAFAARDRPRVIDPRATSPLPRPH